jgi:hypothetical protein
VAKLRALSRPEYPSLRRGIRDDQWSVSAEPARGIRRFVPSGSVRSPAQRQNRRRLRNQIPTRRVLAAIKTFSEAFRDQGGPIAGFTVGQSDSWPESKGCPLLLRYH